MRLQSILLLAAAAILISVDATATTTTQARSLTSTGRDPSGKRLLRASVIADADDEEERASISFSGFKKWLNSKTAAKISTKASTTKVASKLAVVDDQVDDVLAKLSLDDAFTKLKLNELVAKPDEFFTSPSFRRWLGLMTQANEGAKTKGGTTVTKFLREKQGDEDLAKMLAQASISEIPAVRKMGSGLQTDHLNQMIKAAKRPSAVDKIPTLSKELKAEYRTLWDAARTKAKRASEKTKEKLNANAAADVL